MPRSGSRPTRPRRGAARTKSSPAMGEGRPRRPGKPTGRHAARPSPRTQRTRAPVSATNGGSGGGSGGGGAADKPPVATPGAAPSEQWATQRTSPIVTAHGLAEHSSFSAGGGAGAGGGGSGGGGLHLPAAAGAKRGPGSVAASVVPRVIGTDAQVSERIEELQAACDMYTKRIEVERRRKDDLGKKLRVTTAKLEKVRAAAGRLDSNEARTSNKRKLVIAENRLNKTLVRLNQAVSHNQKLRRNINDLRRERVHGDAVRLKLEADVSDAERVLLRTLQQSQQAANARERADRQIGVLQDTISSEVQEFELLFRKRMEELQAERDKERALQKQAAVPVSVRARKLASATPEGEATPLTMVPKGEMTVVQEQELKHQSTKALWDVVKREVDLHRQSNLLEHYQAAFARIKASTGIATIDDMVNEFCDAEDQNFSLLNMINSLNKEIEALEVENTDMEASLRETKGKGAESEAQRMSVFQVLEEQIRAVEQKARWYNHKHDEAMKAIDTMKGGLMNVFQKVGCSDDATAENVSATGITDQNVMQVLGIVEQRIAEIVQMNQLSLGRMLSSKTKTTSALAQSSHRATNVGQLPSSLAMSDSDDDEELAGGATKPFSIAELKLRTQASFTRRQDASPKY